MDLDKHQQLAETLLWPIWRGINPDYKEKYKADTWQHFENAIKSAACTSSLATFLEKCCRKLKAKVMAKHRKSILSALTLNDKDTLSFIRKDAQVLVMLVQEMNESRKHEYRSQKESNAAFSEDLEQMNKDLE